jgi:hypothetical protein
MNENNPYKHIAAIISRHENLEDALAEARVMYPRANFWLSTPDNDRDIEQMTDDEISLLAFDFVKHKNTYVRIDLEGAPNQEILQLK